jgi:hypothetical protein
MDAIRWVILVLLFAGLLGAWIWSKRQARLAGSAAKAGGSNFKVVQKRWLDKSTGVCMVESEGQTFLLAYTVGGGVSWQPIVKKPATERMSEPDFEPIENFEKLLSIASLQ